MPGDAPKKTRKPRRVVAKELSSAVGRRPLPLQKMQGDPLSDATRVAPAPKRKKPFVL